MLFKLIFDKTNIYIGNNVFDRLKEYLIKKKAKSFFILVDNNTKLHCLPNLLENLPELNKSIIINVGVGESNKTMKNVQNICSILLENHIERNSLIINLGGGVICDIGGFVSGIINRGVSFINIPTTLMAQVDASIGGKVGVNYNNYKNKIGLFNNPDLILIYPKFTSSQLSDDFLSGKSEVFKYALTFDKQLWEELKCSTTHEICNLEKLIIKCVATKLKIIDLDYYDHSERKKLNFGHSIAHAIESSFLHENKSISHGYALSVGIICEAYLSYQRYNFPVQDLNSVIKLLFKYFPFINIPAHYDSLILNYLKYDKKNHNGYFNFSLIPKIGSCVINNIVGNSEVIASLDYYRKCQV